MMTLSEASNIDLSDIGLSPATERVIRENNKWSASHGSKEIKTLADLAIKTEAELRRLPGIGEKKVCEILGILNDKYPEFIKIRGVDVPKEIDFLEAEIALCETRLSFLKNILG